MIATTRCPKICCKTISSHSFMRFMITERAAYPADRRWVFPPIRVATVWVPVFSSGCLRRLLVSVAARVTRSVTIVIGGIPRVVGVSVVFIQIIIAGWQTDRQWRESTQWHSLHQTSAQYILQVANSQLRVFDWSVLLTDNRLQQCLSITLWMDWTLYSWYNTDNHKYPCTVQLKQL